MTEREMHKAWCEQLVSQTKPTHSVAAEDERILRARVARALTLGR